MRYAYGCYYFCNDLAAILCRRTRTRDRYQNNRTKCDIDERLTNNRK